MDAVDVKEKTGKVTFNISKDERFSEWYSEILERAEIADLRYNVKGFLVIRPWGAMIIEKMYDFYEYALKKTGHLPVFFPTVIPEENFKKEAGHVKGFTPEVFWLEQVSENNEKLALRPTSETAFYQLYSLWIRGLSDLPLKLYQRANIFRFETKATRPLIRAREFYWIEAHDAFATKEEAEAQVQQDIQMTEKIMHQIFGIPFLPMMRPKWDTFPGADYTIGSDSILPDGKVIQQPSTHLLGQRFSEAFNIKFLDSKGRKEYVYQTCYGPAISRILASVIAFHGDDHGLIMPFALAPVKIIIVPIYNEKSSKKVLAEAEKLKKILAEKGIETKVDDSEKRAGDKFFYWEMKGVPLRIELGVRELETKTITLFLRDTGKKKKVKMSSFIDTIFKEGKELDARLLKKADAIFAKSTADCKTKEEIKQALQNKKIARFSFCSIDHEGENCAAYIEKELSARVMGKRADRKEKPSELCIICGKKACEVVYAGKSY